MDVTVSLDSLFCAELLDIGQAILKLSFKGHLLRQSLI
jgi:hypothetical protein